MYEHRDDIQPAAGDNINVLPRRLRWGLLAAVITTVVAAIPGVLLDRGGDDKNVTAAQQFLPATTTTSATPAAGSATPPAPAPPTSEPKGVVMAVQTAPTARTTTTTRRPGPAPAPAPACRNSYDAACGPFRWDPEPGPNAPLTVAVTPPSQQVIAGKEVNFHVVADDPDAKIDRCYAVDFGDGEKGGTCPAP